MVLNNAYPAALLAIFIVVGFPAGYSADNATPPDVFHGFFPYVINHVKDMFLNNRKLNNFSEVAIAREWNITLTEIARDVNITGGKIGLIVASIAKLFKQGNSTNQDMVGKLLALITDGTSDVGLFLDLVTNSVTMFNQLFQDTSALMDDTYNAVTRNVKNFTDMAVYIPDQVTQKLIIFYNQVMVIVKIILKILVAVAEQIQIAVLRSVIQLSNAEIPVQSVISAVVNEIKSIVSVFVDLLTKLKNTVVGILLNIKNTTTSAIEGALNPLKNEFQRLLERIKGLNKGITNTTEAGATTKSKN